VGKKFDQLRVQIARFAEFIALKIIERVNKITSDPTNYQNAGLWTSAFVAAAVSVAYTKLFRIAESGYHALLEVSPYAGFALTPLLFLGAWWSVRRYAPEASGSGIPQIMAANEVDYTGENRHAVDRLLSLRTAAIKIASSLLCVLGGGAIGREGPTLQISTSVFHFFGKQVRKFTTHTAEHVWVVAGAAGGLASAFNTPLGGIVYAIEELGLVHFHKIRTALISGVIVSGLVAQWLLGSYLYLGFPSLTVVGFSILPVALLNGGLSGLLGAAFGRMLLYFLNRRLSIVNTKRLAFITVGCGLLVAGLCFYDRRASGAGLEVITGLLFQGEQSSFVLVCLRTLSTLASYLSGAAGGIFSPSLAIGATFGSYLSQFVGTEHTNLMVLLGMIGFLTGVTRTPFTSFILVLEMTDRHSAIFPMMLAALAALWTSHLVDPHSFYEHVKHKYIPKPAPPPPPATPPASPPASVT
jgi:H+/Cl- antiporter ClcA